MKAVYLIAFFLFASILPAKAGQKIPFTIAKHYFVKNTVATGGLKNPKISDQKTFDQYFGIATVMGNDGKPTTVDFNKEFVIAVLQEETNLSSELIPVSLEKTSRNTLTFIYNIRTFEEQSFSIRPSLIIVVDNNFRKKCVKINQQHISHLSQIEP